MTSREAFEAWVTGEALGLGEAIPDFSRDLSTPEQYGSWSLQLQWESWQAALVRRDRVPHAVDRAATPVQDKLV